jgi:hypothetical protein
MKSRKSFLLRLDPALYDALERWAQQDLRSVNGQIEFLLKQAVLARDRKALPADEARRATPTSETAR